MTDSRDSQTEWDTEALVFDDEAHHALEEPAMRDAWVTMLRGVLPAPPATTADLGCGTGSVTVLLAELGYDATGVDLSPAMVAKARAKATRFGVPVKFAIGDAARLPRDPVDVVLTRHVAWAVPGLDAAIRTWAAALNPGGRMVLIEGLWSNGAGISADALGAVVRRHLPHVTVRELDDPTLWGYPPVDSRYVLVAQH